MSKSIPLGILCLFMLRLSILSIECCNPTSLPCLMFSCVYLHTSSLGTHGMSWILKKECCQKKHLEFDEGGREPRALLWNPAVPFSPSLSYIRIVCHLLLSQSNQHASLYSWFSAPHFLGGNFWVQIQHLCIYITSFHNSSVNKMNTELNPDGFFLSSLSELTSFPVLQSLRASVPLAFCKIPWNMDFISQLSIFPSVCSRAVSIRDRSTLQPSQSF